MDPQANESVDDESINPQALSWAQHAKAEIKHNTPESLQPQLLDRVEQFISEDTSPAEKKLEQQNLESLIKNARTLNEAMVYYIDHMTPLSQNWMLKEHVQSFWNDFTFEQLETNALQKVLDELVEKVEHSEKEAAISTEKKSEIMDQIESKKFAPYFTTKERNKLYSQYKKVRKNKALTPKQKAEQENELDLAISAEVLERQKFKNKKLDLITRKKEDIPYVEKQFTLLQKKCGERVFELPEVDSLYQEFKETKAKIKKAEDNLKNAHSNFEAAIEEYTEEVGQPPSSNVIPFIPSTAESETSSEETEELLPEAFESKEAKIKVVEELRKEAQNTAKYWGERGTDRQHARRGVTGTMNLLAAGAMESYSLENYEEEISKVGHLVPYNEKYSRTEGRKIPEIFYDLPTEADAFTSDMASSTANKIKAAQNLSEHGRAAASLFYNNYYRDKDPNTIAPSIYEFIGTCNAMIHQLRAGKQVKDIPKAA